MDRFLMQLSMGYTDKEGAIAILNRFVAGAPDRDLSAVCTREELLEMRETVKKVYVHPDIAAYTVDIVEATRSRDDVALGVSPRGNLNLVKAAQALAAIRGRSFVSPQDVKDLAKPVLGHRLILSTGMRNRSTQIENIIGSILDSIPAPTENWKTD